MHKVCTSNLWKKNTITAHMSTHTKTKGHLFEANINFIDLELVSTIKDNNQN